MFVWWLNFPTFASRFGGRETERKNREKEFQKRFAKQKKISTFAVPNKTGVTKRSLLTE
jgi:hypothetical protein